MAMDLARNGALKRLFRATFLLNDSARNAAMEGLRGYAALVTFFAHLAVIYAGMYRGVNLETFNLFGPGHRTDKLLYGIYKCHFGVELFFLLSGFLIFRILARQGASFSYASFLGKRALRIYPAFLLSIAYCIWLGDCWRTLTWSNLAKNLFFLHGLPWVKLVPYNNVTWSLSYEVIFYLLAPFLYLLGRRAEAARPRWGILMVAATLCSFYGYAYLPRWGMFLFGAVLGVCPEADLRSLAGRLSDRGVLALFQAAALGYAVKPFGWYDQLFVPVFGVAASLLFVQACYGTGFLRRLLSLTFLRWLGNTSYSFYLIHVPVTGYVLWWLKPYLAARPPGPAVLVLGVVSFVASAACATVLYLIAERWYFRQAAPKAQGKAEEWTPGRPAELPTRQAA